MIKERLLSKSLLHQLLSLLFSKTSKNRKSYTFFVTIVGQVACLDSNIIEKDYLQINGFPANSSQAKKKVSRSIIKSYWELMMVDYRKRSPLYK